MRKFWRPGKQSNKFIPTSNVSIIHWTILNVTLLTTFHVLGDHSWMQRYILLQHWLPVDRHHRAPSRYVKTQNYFSLHQGFISGSFSDFGDQFYVLTILFLSTYLPGTYTFKMAINPEYKIPEISFENNAALCNLHYNEVYASIHNCSHIRPWIFFCGSSNNR